MFKAMFVCWRSYTISKSINAVDLKATSASLGGGMAPLDPPLSRARRSRSQTIFSVKEHIPRGVQKGLQLDILEYGEGMSLSSSGVESGAGPPPQKIFSIYASK